MRPELNVAWLKAQEIESKNSGEPPEYVVRLAVPTKLLVSIDEAAKVDDVARRLRNAGVRIDEKDVDFRLITGSTKSANLDLLRKILGVAHVEEQRTISLPEADSAVQ